MPRVQDYDRMQQTVSKEFELALGGLRFWPLASLAATLYQTGLDQIERRKCAQTDHDAPGSIDLHRIPPKQSRARLSAYSTRNTMTPDLQQAFLVQIP
jgi:hypothetical protein